SFLQERSARRLNLPERIYFRKPVHALTWFAKYSTKSAATGSSPQCKLYAAGLTSRWRLGTAVRGRYLRYTKASPILMLAIASPVLAQAMPRTLRWPALRAY